VGNRVFVWKFLQKQPFPDKTESEVKPDAAKSADYPLSLTELFSRTHMQMVLLQLPDCLPGRGPEKEMAPPPSRPSTSNTALKSNDEIVDPPETPKPAAESNKCCLGHLQEGQIGKIVRYRSGRTKLILGDTHYELALGMEAGFLQDLMAIETNREQRNGDMVKLGEVNAKINATPDWEHLFSKATT
jgi:DNA-directed RNA polymerase III subunit RPC4